MCCMYNYVSSTKAVPLKCLYVKKAYCNLTYMNFIIHSADIWCGFVVLTFNFYAHCQDENGNKMVNEYVRECKIGSGSYGKVVSLK